MSDKVSEKAAEMLFSHNALRRFRAGEASIFAPSSRQEYIDGYDARLIGADGFRELFLQFKAPRPLAEPWFSFSATPHQHRRLRLYQRGAAWYVSHTFRSLGEIQKAQRELGAKAFLRRFIAIEAGGLPDDLCFVQFTASSGRPSSAWHKRKADGNKRKAPHLVGAGGWTTGSALLARFKKGQSGAWVLPAGGSQDEDIQGPALLRGMPWSLPSDAVERMPAGDRENWGIGFRVDAGYGLDSAGPHAD